MKEFDFDELDRAVHAVLEDEKRETQARATPERGASVVVSGSERQTVAAVRRARIPSVNIHARTMASARPARSDVSVSDVAAPDDQSDTQAASSAARTSDEKETTASIVPPRPIARRRTGRFMDVVHPSSDMKTASMGPSSRVGRTITPPSEQPEVDGSTGVESSREGASLSKEVADLLKGDPLGDTSATSSLDSSTDTPDDAVQSEDKTTQEVDNAAAPLTSPFIEDAQVEKRPLGGRTPKETKPPKEESALDELETATHSDIEKLHEKIEAIETVQLDGEPNIAGAAIEPVDKIDLKSDTQTEAVAKDSPVEESLADNKDKELPAAPDDDAKQEASPEEAVVSGPTSIAKQYKEVPRVASEEDTSPIFDPENYQQTLEHEPKKKSGWGWVIAIILLLLLGAGVAIFLWQSGLLVAPL